jgi:hypothetical protein
MSGFWTALVTVLTAIVGVAIVATLVSRNAQTPAVLNSFWGGFSNALTAATGPVTGASATGFGSLGAMVLPGIGTANI